MRQDKLSDRSKTKILGHAIARAAATRGQVSILDGTQAGLSEAEVRLHWDDAVVEARAIEPRLPDMVLAP